MLIDKLSKIKAHEIPSILSQGLFVPISEEETKHFNRIRSQRNAIAHGDTVNIRMDECMKDVSILLEIAQKSDQHVIEHFFIIEKYA